MEMTPQELPQSENSKIPKDQWELPIGFDNEGKEIRLIDLKENPDRPEKMLLFEQEDYSEIEMRELVIKRLEGVDNYSSFQLGQEVIDLQRAKEEVENKTKLGAAIIEIEMETIKAMVRNMDV